MKPTTIADYLSACSPAARAQLQQLRDLMKELVPDAEEKVAYDMIAYRYADRALLYFGAWKGHIGLYPGTSTLPNDLAELLAPLRASKGSIHLPISGLLPIDILRRLIAFRAEENRMFQVRKKAKKS